MQGDTHLISGVLTGAVLHPSDPFGWGFLLLGSILPDIDHPASLLGRYVPVSLLVRHRGPLHSLALALAAVYVNPWLGLGYGLHLLLDSGTPSGCVYLWPFVRKRIKTPWAVIPTGSAGELLVKFLMLGALAVHWGLL